jgi:hypothetical protein
LKMQFYMILHVHFFSTGRLNARNNCLKMFKVSLVSPGILSYIFQELNGSRSKFQERSVCAPHFSARTLPVFVTGKIRYRYYSIFMKKSFQKNNLV